ncbi:MAG: metallophosphoesterase [Planctomycetota bacterium]
MVAEPLGRVALFGGVYSNYYALVAAIADARSRGAERLYCLGDLGAFGPHPDRVFPVLIEHRVTTIQGNYDHSLGHRKQDCACGYTDPKDNHFARLSYEYTYAHTADRWKDWLRDLPPSLTIRVGEEQVLLCHGSPRRTNEFLWESTTPDPFLRRLFRQHPERAIACTHTGIHWQREVDDRLMVNVGVLGRPENNGSTKVGYCLLDADPSRASGLRAEYVDLAYDHTQLAEEMRAERLPEEFVETILTGWWTSCLEILPAKERAAGQR